MDPQFYHTLAAVQDRHWWYAARRYILGALLEREIAKGVPDGVLYDLGCGVGCNLGILSQFRRTIGIDPSPEAIALCREMGHQDLLLGSAEQVAALDAPDPAIVVLTDVLEHVDDHQACIRDISRRLPIGGVLIVTVPAFEFLWGPSDETSHHFRRYRKGQLRKLIEPYFSIELLTYFNTILFPPIALGRFLERLLDRPGDEGAGVPAPWLNALLREVMQSELPFIKMGALPFGVSLLAVLRNRKAE